MKQMIVLCAGILCLILLNAEFLEAKDLNKKPLPSITGTITLLERHFLSSVVQIKKNGKKGGLQSVRAIVNHKTEIKYKGKDIPFRDLTVHSKVRVAYERIKGIVVARTITVKKLYPKSIKKD